MSAIVSIQLYVSLAIWQEFYWKKNLIKGTHYAFMFLIQRNPNVCT